MFVIAHLSDCHIDGTADRADRLRRTLAHATDGQRKPDVVLLTGDVADSGRPEQYLEAARLLGQVKVPVLAIPGNHDERAAFRAGLLTDSGPADVGDDDAARDDVGGADVGDDGPLNRVRHIGAVTLLLLDSTIPGEDGGRLEPASLRWLGRQLDAAARGPDRTPVILVLHHPPVTIGAPGLDAIALAEPVALQAELARHGPVTAILCGHVHGATSAHLGTIPVLAAPGIASTFRLPWEPGGTALVDPVAQPGLAFHVIADDGSLTSHVRWVGAPDPTRAVGPRG